MDREFSILEESKKGSVSGLTNRDVLSILAHLNSSSCVVSNVFFKSHLNVLVDLCAVDKSVNTTIFNHDTLSIEFLNLHVSSGHSTSFSGNNLFNLTKNLRLLQVLDQYLILIVHLHDRVSE